MKTYEIPSTRLPKGILLCKDNIKNLLDNARNLLQKGAWQARSHAVALVVFAIEELGKAIILKKALELSKIQGKATVEVDTVAFGLKGRKSHELKFKGCSILNSALLIIEKAAFDPKVFDPNVFATKDVEVNSELRLEALFVDWDNDNKLWRIGTAGTTERIEELIKDIQRALDTI